jgi:recombination protein RecA
MLLAKQHEGESVVWIEPTDGPLYPPDLAAAGVDLDALVIVRVPTKEGPEGLCRVAEWLVRSGGFGLVVMDLMGRTPAAHNPWQTRLSGLLRRHDAQLCVLSDSETQAPSLGAMVALRLEPQRQRDEDGTFVLSQRVLKNKLGALETPSSERRRAPAGLEVLPILAQLGDPLAQLSLFDTLDTQLPLPLVQPVQPMQPVQPAQQAVPIPLRPVAPPVVLRPKVAAKRVSASDAAQAVEHGLFQAPEQDAAPTPITEGSP